MPQQTSRLLRATSIRLTVLGLLVLLAAAYPGHMWAQTAGEGTITGTVTDNTGAVIGGATVTAINVATNLSAAQTTTKEGLYSISPLELVQSAAAGVGHPGARPHRVCAAGTGRHARYRRPVAVTWQAEISKTFDDDSFAV